MVYPNRKLALTAALAAAVLSLAPAQAEGENNEAAPSITSTNQFTIIPLSGATPPNFVRIEAAGSAPRTDDFLSDVFKATKDRVFRFKTMPIPVFIEPFPDRGFTEACIQGFEQWEKRSNGLVRFVQIDQPKDARVKVIWKHLGVDPNNPDMALGAHTITKWKMKTPATIALVPGLPLPIPKLGPKYHVPPQLIEVNLDLIYAREPENRLLLLKNVVTHELGHALGILGHSPMRSDLMFKDTDECSRLSQRDVNTLLRLYQMKPNIEL